MWLACSLPSYDLPGIFQISPVKIQHCRLRDNTETSHDAGTSLNFWRDISLTTDSDLSNVPVNCHDSEQQAKWLNQSAWFVHLCFSLILLTFHCAHTRTHTNYFQAIRCLFFLHIEFLQPDSTVQFTGSRHIKLNLSHTAFAWPLQIVRNFHFIYFLQPQSNILFSNPSLKQIIIPTNDPMSF